MKIIGILVLFVNIGLFYKTAACFVRTSSYTERALKEIPVAADGDHYVAPGVRARLYPHKHVCRFTEPAGHWSNSFFFRFRHVEYEE